MLNPILRERIQSAGQSHLIAHHDSLPDTTAQSNFAHQLESIDWQAIARLARTALFSSAASATPPPDQIEPAVWYPRDPSDPRRPYDAETFRAKGEAIIRRGAVAVLLVAGGQGTRLGWDGPKGTFLATPIHKKPLFQVFVESIRKSASKYNCTIPLAVMTSPLNHDTTIAFFEKHNYFGLHRNDTIFFSQGVMPSFDLATGRILLESPGRIALNPDGHGGSLKALASTGALAQLKSRGIEHLAYIQVDNPLVKTVDPLFIGLHAAAPDSSAEMSSKMLPKTGPREKLGVFCHVQNRTVVIEYSDLPAQLAEARDSVGRLCFAAGSIAVHVISLDFIDRLTRDPAAFALPFHRAVKKVPCLDPATGNRLDPTTPNAVKLESFVFDALPLARSSIILQTDRAEEFAPIKNPSGDDSAESSSRIQIERHARWLENAGVRIPRDSAGAVDATLEISPLTAVEPDDLRALSLPASIDHGSQFSI